MNSHNKPLISVLLPLLDFDFNFYNAIRSILRQTFKDFEVIVLYPNKIEPPKMWFLKDTRIKLFSCPPSWNLSRTLNFGLHISHGELIARMDADDISDFSRFEHQVKFLRDNKHVSLCGTWAKIFGTENDFFKPADRWDLLRIDSLYGCQFIHPSVMFRRQTVLENNLYYDESLVATEDFELWSRWIEISPMANLSEVLLRYRKHLTSATNRNKEIGESIYTKTMGNLLRRGGFKVTNHELEIHFKAFNAKEISDTEFETLSATLQRLLFWNDRAKFYNVHYLGASIIRELARVKSHQNF
jgi:glycosyltransferase involved in cell wall biosynthesis